MIMKSPGDAIDFVYLLNRHDYLLIKQCFMKPEGITPELFKKKNRL